MNRTIWRWESKRGAHWVELVAYPNGAYGYTSNNAGGSFGLVTQEQALAQITQRIDSGYFLPDAAKFPMVKVA